MYWSKLRDMSSSMYNYIMPIKMSRMQPLLRRDKKCDRAGQGKDGLNELLIECSVASEVMEDLSDKLNKGPIPQPLTINYMLRDGNFGRFYQFYSWGTVT